MDNDKIIEIGKGDRHLIPAFLDFTKNVFPGADFRKWIELGYWTGDYTLHSLISEERIISNVSATPMDIFFDGKKKRGVQIGTVGTIPEERNKGLSKLLMDHVLKKYENRTDLFFLFANETVLNFYPKFGFTRTYESIYHLSGQAGNSGKGLKKLSLDSKGDRHLIDQLLKNRFPLTKLFGADHYESITWWHLINVYKDDIYYWENENLLIVMYPSKGTLKLIDIVSAELPRQEKIIEKISGFGDTASILFHFPPDQILFPYNNRERDEGTMLFVRGDFYPEPGFKFPTTAQT